MLKRLSVILIIIGLILIIANALKMNEYSQPVPKTEAQIYYEERNNSLEESLNEEPIYQTYEESCGEEYNTKSVDEIDFNRLPPLNSDGTWTCEGETVERVMSEEEVQESIDLSIQGINDKNEREEKIKENKEKHDSSFIFLILGILSLLYGICILIYRVKKTNNN